MVLVPLFVAAVYSLLVRWLEEVNNEKALWQLFVAMRELAMSKIPPAAELVQLWGQFKSIYLLSGPSSCLGEYDLKYLQRVVARNGFSCWRNADV